MNSLSMNVQRESTRI